MPSPTLIMIFVVIFVPILALYLAWVRRMRMPNWLVGIAIAMFLYVPPVPLAVLLVASLLRQSWAARWPVYPILIAAIGLVSALWISGVGAVEWWISRGRRQRSS
jgi:hypothetical protein